MSKREGLCQVKSLGHMEVCSTDSDWSQNCEFMVGDFSLCCTADHMKALNLLSCALEALGVFH